MDVLSYDQTGNAFTCTYWEASLGAAFNECVLTAREIAAEKHLPTCMIFNGMAVLVFESQIAEARFRYSYSLDTIRTKINTGTL